MNLDKFEERWRLEHPYDTYMPPFIGGPIDEIFMLGGSAQNLTVNLPIRIDSMGKPLKTKQSALPVSPSLRAAVNRNGKTRATYLQPRIPVGRSAGDRLTCLTGMWVRVDNIPPYLFHLIYYFFINLGTLDSMRAYNDETFYLLYKHPKDTLRALNYHKKRVIFLDQVVCFTCTVIKPSAMEMINNDQTDDNDITNIDLINLPQDEEKCKELFIYDDEFAKEFDVKLNAAALRKNQSCPGAAAATDATGDADALQLNKRCSVVTGASEIQNEQDDDYYALSETVFVEMSQSLLKYWLRGTWEWFKVHMVSLIEYIKCDVLN